MRFYDPASAAVMRKASRGPAAIALRQARLVRGGFIPVNPGASKLSTGGSLGVLYRSPGNIRKNPYKLGALGAGTAGTVATKVGTTYASTEAGAAATGLATYIGAGAAAGPIGLVVGAIVGIVLTKIFNKQYLDVTSANNIADASFGVFKQYQAIAGQVAGRNIGLASMNAIWKGAMYSGLFPLNNQQLCFHNGCLKYRGQPEWIEATINGPDNQFTLGGVYNNFLMGSATSTAPTTSSAVIAPTAPTARIGMTRFRGLGHWRHQGFSGIGALGAINGVPEAVVLVDQYLIPANTRDSPAWLVPRSAMEHQILYDVADAWLAQKHPELNTTPYVAIAPTTATAPPVPQPSPSPVPPPVLPVPVANPQPMPVVPPQDGGPVQMPIQSLPGTGAGGGVMMPLPAYPPGMQPPGGPTIKTASLAPSGLTEILSSPLGLLALAGFAFAVVPMMSHEMPRRSRRKYA